jgi:multidrug resistance efflux pump
VPNRFSSIFPSLNMAVKRREQALQDYGRLQAKVEKYEEKEKTGPVLAKLHQVQGRRNRLNGTTIATGSSFQDLRNQDTSYFHPPCPLQ